MGKVDLTLNGTPVSGSEGMTILELAQENGVDIPTLCYMSELAPTGACRVCVVEVKGAKTLVAACHTPIQPKMDIQTHSPTVLEARRVILELMLASHPDSCLICDKANRCDLRRLATDLGVGLPRFGKKRRYYPLEDVSPYIVRDLTKCVLCQRCVIACREIKGEDVFNIGYRGPKCKIIVDFDKLLDKDVCESCDVCIEACPVGALARREERFSTRKETPVVITG